MSIWRTSIFTGRPVASSPGMKWFNESKHEVRVYDYADLNVPMLARMFDRRCRGYEAVGYWITLPASAVPGWSAGVTLPADPAWKSDNAASVRRLIREGVDAPLARLFVHAALPTINSEPRISDAASVAKSGVISLA